MTVLNAIYDAGGKPRQCDARCYNSKQPHCDCVCNGKNHGRGVQVAAQNAIADAAEWLENATPDSVKQLELLALTARDLRQVAWRNFLAFADTDADCEPAD